MWKKLLHVPDISYYCTTRYSNEKVRVCHSRWQPLQMRIGGKADEDETDSWEEGSQPVKDAGGGGGSPVGGGKC